MTLVGVGQFLITSILPSSVATPLAEIHALDRLTVSKIAHILKVLVLTLPPQVSGSQPQVSRGG